MVEFNPNIRRDEDRPGTTHKPYRPAGRGHMGSVEPIDREDIDHDRNEFLRDDFARSPAPEPLGRTPPRKQLPRDDRTIFDLFRELTDEVRLLLRQEVNLARAEMMQKAKDAARHMAYIAAGGAIAYAGVLALVAAACAGMVVLMTWAGLGVEITLWLAPLIVGLIVAAIGYGVYKSGINKLRKDDMVPHRTAQTMRENAQWMHERTTK